jgi:UDP-N-acetylmuramoyl-tripeptide--D-alanyl-D-alanine ligase
MKKALAGILAFLARGIISKYKPKIVGITGSFGKSSTKEAVFAVLSSGRKKVRRSRGNFNNELGFPLSIIGDFKKTGGAIFWLKAILKGFYVWLFKVDYPDILILEYGADKPGDIKYLGCIARPDVAIITGISDIPVHIEFYASIEEVVKEKRALLKLLKQNGTAVLNADDELVAKMAEGLDRDTIFFGFNPEADFKVAQFSNRLSEGVPIGISFKLETVGKSVPVVIPGTIGKAQGYAGAAAVACGSIFGANFIESAGAISEYNPLPGRANIIEGINNSWIIDDAYNASPKAVEEALSALKSLSGIIGRKIVALGGMKELGKYSDEAHSLVGKMAGSFADIIIGVGEEGKIIVSEAEKGGKKTMWFDSSVKTGEALKKIIREGDIVLIKGSQSVRMEHAVKAIMKYPEKASKLLVRQYGNWLKE